MCVDIGCIVQYLYNVESTNKPIKRLEAEEVEKQLFNKYAIYKIRKVSTLNLLKKNNSYYDFDCTCLKYIVLNKSARNTFTALLIKNLSKDNLQS